MTDKLIQGANEFKRYQYGEQQNLMTKLVEEGQNPKYFIISCIDSRADPGTIFRAKPGVFFAHKAMGAIVRPYKRGKALAAALQFALNYNEVDTIIVLGHTNCGAVQALTDGLEDPEIASFINVAKSAVEKAKSCCDCKEDLLKRTEQEVVLESTENLKKYPCVAKALEENRVNIKSWIFDIETGDLLEYAPETKKFHTLTETQPKKDSRKNA